MTLEHMGWNDFFKQHAEETGKRYDDLARVTGVGKNGFWVCDGQEEYPAKVSGRFFRLSADRIHFPATGDWVTVKQGVIAAVLPRINALSRGESGSRGKREAYAKRPQVIAANIDTVLIVCGLDRDYNLRRIERYLTLVYNCGCSPVVILNKADLHPDAQAFSLEVSEIAVGVPVHLVSAKTRTGLEALNAYLKTGETVVLLGSSGAGKSTLVNALAGTALRATRPVSSRQGKGVHTTTSRDLIRLPGGGMIIDNPGLREIAFWDDTDGMDGAFPEIDALAQQCRFSDCSHRHEPGCRVREAVESGEISSHRLENYIKMKRELDFLSQRRHKSADRIEKERWKSVALHIKRIKKN